MNRGCSNYKIGDVVKGLKIISEPYKIIGDKNYRAMVECQFCGRKYEIVLSEIKRHIFDGCGCQKNRSTCEKWKSFKDWCIENKKDEIIESWDYELNNKNPEDVSYCTSNEYYFKCPKNIHNSSLWKIINITNSNKTKTICRYCNSFAQHLINELGVKSLDLYWDYEKNEASPYDILYGSKKEIWIKCLNANHHGSYKTTPKTFLSGVRCPRCRGLKVCREDSFASFYINQYGEEFFNSRWDYDKNVVDPWTISITTNQKIWLKCDKHGSYQEWPNNLRKKEDMRCPICSKEQEKSSFQIKTEQYIQNMYGHVILHEYDCSIVAINPRTLKTMPYDNDVIINQNTHLIIEVNGTQHYYASSGWNRREAKRLNISPEEVLKNVQWRDNYKKQFALDNGYFYLEIPSSAFISNVYKTLIDDKISYILSLKNNELQKEVNNL